MAKENERQHHVKFQSDLEISMAEERGTEMLWVVLGEDHLRYFAEEVIRSERY